MTVQGKGASESLAELVEATDSGLKIFFRRVFPGPLLGLAKKGMRWVKSIEADQPGKKQISS